MAGRTIPIALAENLRTRATTPCRCWRIAAVGVAPFGLTSLDRDVVFDDGDGPITYKARRGFTPYTISATSDLAVDNSEMEVLISEFAVDGITAEAIARGVYDDARFVEYLVNYESPADGAVIMSSGTIGKVRQVDGMSCFPELRSLTQTLKQKSIIEKGSNSCRVVAFGDERCKYDVDVEWVDAEVGGIGAEADRVFAIAGDDLSADDDYYAPGLFEFATGANAGRSYEIETYVDGVITLAMPTELLIEEGDTGRVRRDCTRLLTGHNSCTTYANRLNYRGEWYRPVADTGQDMIPGASSSSGVDLITESA